MSDLIDSYIQQKPYSLNNNGDRPYLTNQNSTNRDSVNREYTNYHSQDNQNINKIDSFIEQKPVSIDNYDYYRKKSCYQTTCSINYCGYFGIYGYNQNIQDNNVFNSRTVGLTPI